MLRAFYQIITDAVRDMADHGYDSEERLKLWVIRIRQAARDSLISEGHAEDALRHGLNAAFVRLVDKGGVLKNNPGVSKFTIERIKPKLRAELDRRIAASANLIKLNREQAIETTLRRFQGWSTSIPPGGTDAANRQIEAANIRKSLARLPFEERRVAIDQTHKLSASINHVVAVDAGALAIVWHSHWRQPGYDYRQDHKERDLHVYMLRGNWAVEKGLIKPGADGYYDQITAVAEEPYCRCFAQSLFNLRDLPDSMLTEKGKQALKNARAQ